MLAWLAHAPNPTANEAWNALLDLAEAARIQQETNSKLIAVQLQHTQQALNALMTAGGQPMTYGPDGHQRLGGGGRVLGSA